MSATFCNRLDYAKASPAEILSGLAALCSLPSEETEETNADSHDLDLRDVQATLEGDEEAFRRLVERRQGMISAMMWRFSRDYDNHEELVQDVFIEAYFSLKNFRARAPFSHWLCRIATRVGYRFWKKQAREKRLPTVPLQEWDHLKERPLEDVEPEQAGKLLHQLLENLPPRDRLVLTLRYVENKSVEETARLSGWSRTMVKVQCWRARKKLKKLFKEAGVESIK